MGWNQYLVTVAHLLCHPDSQQQVPQPALEPTGVLVTHHDAVLTVLPFVSSITYDTGPVTSEAMPGSHTLPWPKLQT